MPNNRGGLPSIYFHIMYPTLALAKGENPMVNIAWLAKAKQSENQLALSASRVGILMIKATLLELYQRMTSIDGYCHYWDGTFNRFVGFCRRLAKVDLFAYFVKNETQVENTGSKRIVRVIGKNAGLSKGRKTYGNGVAIVPGLCLAQRYGGLNSPRRGSATFELFCNRKHYSTGSTHPFSPLAVTPNTAREEEVNVMKKLQSLKERAEAFPHKAIDRDLMHILCRPEFLMMAYDNIKSKPGNMTAASEASSPETLDGISQKWFEETSIKLQTEQFEFKPARRISIAKASGGTRPLTIASPREKIIQEAMRIILEIIFEPTFYDSSHGFRPNRSCHTALKTFYDSFKYTQ